MACSGCERRRQKIRQMAQVVTNQVRSAFGRTPVEPAVNAAQSGPCAGCTTRSTVRGWVNVCQICLGQSEPSASPNSADPICTLPECKRK